MDAPTTTPCVLVPLLPGFEEIEAVTIVDVLRRADVPVVVASDEPGLVRGAHDIELSADRALLRVSPRELGAVVLPGGMPGAKHLAEHGLVKRLLREVCEAGGYVGAVCAAPIALAAAGVIPGKRVTCYPGFESYLQDSEWVDERVVVDGKVVTSRGPGTALEFALTLVGLLVGKDAEERLHKGMIACRP